MEDNLKKQGSERYTVFPIRYQNLWEFYKKHEATFWTTAEVRLSDDLDDWNNKLNDNERYFLKNVLAFFAASDGIVNENLVVNFYNEVQIPEARQFYAVQMMMEAIHCVAPETKIMTDKGYHEIQKLVNQRVNVWNGAEWSQVLVQKTSENDKLLKVVLSNGIELSCTTKHKWHIRHGNQNHPERCKNIIKHTEDLTVGDVIITDWCYPVVKQQDPDTFLNAYTHGFFCGDGAFSNGYPTLYLYGEKIKLLPYLQVSSNKEGKTQKACTQERVQCYLTGMINKDKYFVPINYSVDTKLRWLEGYVDADGTANLNPKKTSYSVQIASINRPFLQNVQLMLSTLGVDSTIKLSHKEQDRELPTHVGTDKRMYRCKACYVLYLSCYNTAKLVGLGFNPKRVVLDKIDHTIKQNKSLIRIVDVIDNDREDATYCFNEPKEHKGIFNGILTGQSEQYALLIDTYITDTVEKNRLFSAVETIPAIKRKADWAIKWIEEGSTTVEMLPEDVKQGITKLSQSNSGSADASVQAFIKYFTKQRPSLAQRLLAYICVEGIFFSGSFCAIYWLKSRGLMPGLATANEFISRDENLHAEFAIELYKMLEEKLDQSVVHDIFKQAVEIEQEFITKSLPVSLIGMNCALMSEYIEYIADRWLVILGCDKIYNTANPFGFMELISVNTRENFFETNVSQYIRTGVGQTEADMAIVFDDDDF